MLSNRAFADAVIRFGEKFDRGGKHLDSLNESAQRFGERHGDPGILCRTKSNPQATKCLIRVEQVPKPERGDSVQWGVIVGDSVHCWRSALDHLAAAPEAIRSKPVVKTFHDFIAPAIASVLRDFHDVHHGKPLAEPWLAPKPSEVE